MYLYKKKIILFSLIIFFSLCGGNLFSQNNTTQTETGLSSYKNEFPINYSNGYDLYTKLREYTKSLKLSESDARLAFAIVFPELMRYSEFRVEIETMTNKVLYTADKDSEGLSIGVFQIKPIFAESIEQYIAKSPELKSKYPKINYYGEKTFRSNRIARIKRLKNPETEIFYVLAFIDICEKKFELDGDTSGTSNPSASMEQKIKILATAYNSGFFYSKEQILEIAKKSAYPYGLNHPQSKWNYAQISYDFWMELK